MVVEFGLNQDLVTGIDPSTGQPKFKVPIPNWNSTDNASGQVCKVGPSGAQRSVPLSVDDPIIAGDGYAYLTYVLKNEQGQSQDAVQPFPPGLYPLFTQLGTDFGNHNSGAVIGDVGAIVAAAGYTLDTSNPTCGRRVDRAMARCGSPGLRCSPILDTMNMSADVGNTQTAASIFASGISPIIQPICNSTLSTNYELHLLKVGSDGSSADTVVHQWQTTSSTIYGRTLNTDPQNGFWTYTQTQSETPNAFYTREDWNRGLITNADQGVLMCPTGFVLERSEVVTISIRAISVWCPTSTHLAHYRI